MAPKYGRGLLKSYSIYTGFGMSMIKYNKYSIYVWYLVDYICE